MFFSAMSSRASTVSNAWSCIPGLAHINLRKSHSRAHSNSQRCVSDVAGVAGESRDNHGMVEISDRGGDVWFLGGEVADAHFRASILYRAHQAHAAAPQSQTATESKLHLHTLVEHLAIARMELGRQGRCQPRESNEAHDGGALLGWR